MNSIERDTTGSTTGDCIQQPTRHEDELELELPKLPRLPSTNIGLTDFLAGTSSDPPEFSSDDVAPTAENYSARRRKHHYIAPWWQPPSSQTHPRKKRRMQRNFDSGVFMGSEQSFASSDIPSSELDRLSTHEVSDLTELDSDMLETSLPTQSRAGDKRKMPLGDDARSSTFGTREPQRFKLALSNPDRVGTTDWALTIVEDAVENGNETVDLNGAFAWEHVDDSVNSVFHPLHHMIKTRQYDDPSRYEELVPDLRLYLSSNKLEMIPSEVYRLVNLTELGLRNNKLRSLEPFVDNLVRLHRLNLQSNRLQWLPIEVTRLPVLEDLYIDEAYLVKGIAPGLQGQSSRVTVEHHGQVAGHSGLVHLLEPVQNKLSHEKTRWTTQAVSQVSYMDKAGRRLPGSPGRPSETRLFKPSSKAFAPAGHETPGVKTLMELAITKASEVIPRDKIDLAREWFGDLYGSGEDYGHLRELLEQALAVQEKGQKRCFCGKTYIIARAEWFEWTAYKGAMVVPLLAKACSWKCAEERMAEHSAKTGPTSVHSGFGWEW